MKIFVAGATGVIGRRVVPSLVRAGHDVTAVSRGREKSVTLQLQGARPAEVDLFAPDELGRSVAGHDVVINLATAIPPATRALLPGAWRQTARIRSIASPNLIRIAAETGVTRVIQEAFAGIYEDRGEDWIDEQSPVRPARYNRAVMDAERAVEAFAQRRGVGIVLRFAFFYGEDSDFLQQTIQAVKQGWAPALGSPEGFISSVSHDDAASAVVEALTVDSGLYNVVDDEPVAKREFYTSLAEALGVGPPRFPPRFVARLLGSLGETLARSQRISNRMLRSASRWSPTYRSVRDGWRILAAHAAPRST